jgi:hypothetical protein
MLAVLLVLLSCNFQPPLKFVRGVEFLPSKIFKFVTSGESTFPAIVSAGESLFVLFEKLQLLLLGLQ